MTSTDFIRQTMRALFSRELMPSVHYSSFEAALALTKAEEEESGDAALLGFLDQTRNVLVGVEAAIERALREGWSMVLEGVHLVPGMIHAELAEALVVHVVVARQRRGAHRSHFWVRDSSTEGLRPLDKYLEGMPEIRLIQDAILERARRFDVPVIENRALDDAIGEVLDIVLAAPSASPAPSEPRATDCYEAARRSSGPATARLGPWLLWQTSCRRCTRSRIPSSGWTSSSSVSSTTPRSTARR